MRIQKILSTLVFMVVRITVSHRLFIVLGSWLLLSSSTAGADVAVTVGPTTIPRGDARGAGDITIRNDLFAIAFAVDTSPPWGVARGGIIDIASVLNNTTAYDIASLADFMPNKWSSWPTTYQKTSVVKHSKSEAIVKTLRDWGDVDLETTFHVRDGDSKIRIVTRMTNNGKTVLHDLYSGYVVWPDGGSLFGMPGLPGTVAGSEDAARSDWSASYGEHWALGLHAPFSEILAYDGRDRYAMHSLAPGETRLFEAWLQIENDGSLAPMVQAEIDFQQLPSGRIAGRVIGDDSQRVVRPAIVVMQDGLPYAWTLGNNGTYAINLPVGEYDIFATARAYSRSENQHVVISGGGRQTINFDDVPAPGSVQIRVTDAANGKPMDARIDIRDGHKPVIGFLGKNSFFTELNKVGETTQVIAPGGYVFEVSAGGGFTSMPQLLEGVVDSGGTLELNARIPVLANPGERGWFNADLHHHSDVLDGFTKAEFVMRSELAAGVDLAFLSDHDSVVNNHEMRALADARGMHFIPGTELSPSWAHFNAFPLDAGTTVDIDPGQATVQDIFAAARRMGADVIEANHPYSDYGYFNSDEQGDVPGGYDGDFDLAEITTGSAERNNKTAKRVWKLWNDGSKIYFAAGSDVHDVWHEVSGAARTYVHVVGKLTVRKFIAGLKAGCSYASQGPLVYPELMFGSNVQHKAGEALALSHLVQAVSGLRAVQLIARGAVVEERMFDGERNLLQADFIVHPESDTWFSLVIEDMHGKFAYTNPVWVTTAK